MFRLRNLRNGIRHALPGLENLCIFAPALSKRGYGVGLAAHVGVLKVSAGHVEAASKFMFTKAGRDFAQSVRTLHA